MKMNTIMKKYCILIIAGFMAALSGCQSGNQTNALDLEVLEQTDSVFSASGWTWATFDIDVPVNGPQVLVDSVMALINKEVHHMCEISAESFERPEGCGYVAYSEQEMFTNDGTRLLSHYLEKYKQLIKDSVSCTLDFELKMEAQTARFVTFGLECLHCGASCGSYKSYYTYDKSDGHQIKEMISHDNLMRFFKDYPEYRSYIDDGPGDEFINFDYGFLDDNFSIAVMGYDNHFGLLSVPYDEIFPYLSPDAQALVEL